MTKEYLPYFDSLNEKDKEFWLKCTKEELIDHLIGSIRNGEELLSRIERATEYLEKMSYASVIDNPKKDLVKILKRVDKEC
jgi:hypothetical protein